MAGEKVFALLTPLKDGERIAWLVRSVIKEHVAQKRFPSHYSDWQAFVEAVKGVNRHVESAQRHESADQIISAVREYHEAAACLKRVNAPVLAARWLKKCGALNEAAGLTIEAGLDYQSAASALGHLDPECPYLCRQALRLILDGQTDDPAVDPATIMILSQLEKADRAAAISAYTMIAEYYQRGGDHTSAEEIYLKLADLHKASEPKKAAEFFARAGLVRAQDDRLDTAAEHFAEAIRLDPGQEEKLIEAVQAIFVDEFEKSWAAGDHYWAKKQYHYWKSRLPEKFSFLLYDKIVDAVLKNALFYVGSNSLEAKLLFFSELANLDAEKPGIMTFKLAVMIKGTAGVEADYLNSLRCFLLIRKELSARLSAEAENEGTEEEVNKHAFNIIKHIPVDHKILSLMLSNLSQQERQGLSPARLVFLLLSLKAKKPGTERTYEAIISALPKNKRDEAMKRVLSRALQEYEQNNKLLFLEPEKLDARTLLAHAANYFFLDNVFDLAKELKIAPGGLDKVVADLNTKLAAEHSADVPDAKLEFEFAAKEVNLSLPAEYEGRLKTVLTNAFASKVEVAKALETLAPLSRTIKRLRSEGLTPETRQLLQGQVPEALLSPTRLENAIAYLGKRQMTIDASTASALIAMAIKESGREALFRKYLSGQRLSDQETRLLITTLTELSVDLEHAVIKALPDLDYQIIIAQVKNSNDFKIITELKKQIIEQQQVAGSATKTITLLIGKKHLPHLSLGAIGGTCFGDYLSILLPREILAVPILDNGRPDGNVILFVTRINGRPALVMFGFDPSEGMVMALSKDKKNQLADKIMERLIAYCRENGLDLYATAQVGGLSNRAGFEEYILTKYFSRSRVTVKSSRIHPDYVTYLITGAKPLKA